MKLPFEDMTNEQLWKLLGAYVNYIADIMQEDFLEDEHGVYEPSKWMTDHQIKLVMLAADMVGNESGYWSRPSYRVHEEFGVDDGRDIVLDDGPGWWDVYPELDYGQDD